MAINNAANLSNTGIQVINSSGTTFGRTITAGTGISVSNGDGTGGNPTISLSSSGAFALIQSKAASASATLDFTTGITTYTQILVSFYGIYPATNGSSFQMQFSTDGGSTWKSTSYTSGIIKSAYNSTTFSNSTSTTAFLLTGPITNSSANQTANGVFEIFSNNVAQDPYINGMCSYYDQASAVPFQAMIVGQGGFTTANAYRFSMTSGNITAGTVTLYGLATS